MVMLYLLIMVILIHLFLGLLVPQVVVSSIQFLVIAVEQDSSTIIASLVTRIIAVDFSFTFMN